MVTATVEAWMETSQERAFDLIADQTMLPQLFTRHGLIPAVLSSRGDDGGWDRVGAARTIKLADGSTARETVTAFERPHGFAYRVSEPTFALKHLLASATGEWRFEADRGGVRARWAYTFQGKAALSTELLAVFARIQWLGYMRATLENAARICGPR